MVSSKLSVLCDKIIEAGWLAAVIIAPLFFNGYSSTVMEADKLALLRSIAVVMIAVWFVKWIESHKAQPAQRDLTLRSPMVLSALFMTAAYVLATFTSIVPRVSLLGAYHRPEGTFAMLSYIIIFAMVLQGLRSRPQLDRLIVMIILTSLPVALYGIMQKYGLDPLAWNTNFGGRSASTVGNPIFLGAYLIMVFSLTLGKIVENVRMAFTARQSQSFPAEIVLAITYSLIAAAQAIAIVLTDSRGPWLGWFAGIVLFVLLLAIVSHRRRLVLSAFGLGLAGAVFLIVLNLPNTPLESLRATPLFGRLGDLMGTGWQARLFIWENAARLTLPHAPIEFPDGAPDGMNVIRPLVGYGPDAMPLVYPQVSPASPFARGDELTTSHNATWNAWVNIGLIGLIAYQILFLSIFLYGLRWLGLISTPRERNLFVGLWVGLGLAGGLGAIVLGQPKYLGVGIPEGNIIAIILYLVVFALRPNHQPQKGGRGRADQILLISLLAGFFAHYVEGQFGISVPATSTLIWVFAGMLVALGVGRLELGERALASPPTGSSSATRTFIPTWLGSAVGYALVVAMILSTLLYEFVTYDKNLSNPVLILWRGLTFNPIQNVTSFAVLGLISVVWLIALILISSEMTRSQVLDPSNGLRAGWVLIAALPIILAAVFGLGLASQVGALIYLPTPVTHMDDVLVLASKVISITDYYTLTLFALILVTAVALIAETKPLPVAWAARKWSLVALVPVVVVTSLWVNALNLSPIRADVAYRLGQLFDSQSEWSAAIAVYKNAIHLAPTNDVYSMSLARAYQQESIQANTLTPSQFNAQTSMEAVLGLDDQRTARLNRLDLLYSAQTMLLRARDLNPLYADHTINLARFYAPELPVDTPSKAKLVDLANQYYTQAHRLHPNSVLLWNERANFDFDYRGDSDAAIQKLNESLTRDQDFAETYLDLGKIYAARRDYDRAIEYYQRAEDLQPESAVAQSRMAFIYYQQSKFPESIQAYSRYIELAPKAANVWEAHKNLALLYQQTGDLASAIREAQTAANVAPASVKPQIIELVARLHTLAGVPQ